MQLENAKGQIFVIDFGISISLNEVQFSKNPFVISVNDDEIVTFDNFEHPIKMCEPIDFTDDGISIVSNDEQSSKAPDSIVSIDDGIITSVKFEHP